jgi:hypothetical protein
MWPNQRIKKFGYLHEQKALAAKGKMVDEKRL